MTFMVPSHLAWALGSLVLARVCCKFLSWAALEISR